MGRFGVLRERERERAQHKAEKEREELNGKNSRRGGGGLKQWEFF